MKDLRILVTGASSYVGAKIYEDLKKNYQVIGTYFNNKLFEELVSLDLTSEGSVSSLVEELNPSLIVHVAAHSNERQIEKFGADLNLQAVEFLVNAAKKIDAKVIFISSFAAYNDNGIYGESKRQGESVVEKLDDYVILRPSLVMGLSPNTTNDRQFNRLLKIILEKSESKHDVSWEFEMTYLKHLSELVEFIIQHPEVNKAIIPVVARGKATRFKVAKDILESFGLNVEEEDKNAAQVPANPDFSAYEKWKLPSYSYQEAISEIVKEIQQYLLINKK